MSEPTPLLDREGIEEASAEDYESLQETLYLFSTRANAVHILRGLAEVRDGAAQPVELEALAARFDVQAEG